MGSIKFIYDNDNLKDGEIKIVCVDSGTDFKKDIIDSINIFCLESLSQVGIDAKVKEIEDGYSIMPVDGNGEEVLTHIFKYTYLITRAAIVFKDKFEEAAGKTLDVGSLDFSLLHDDIEKVNGMNYKELAELIGEVDENAKD